MSLKEDVARALAGYFGPHTFDEMPKDRLDMKHRQRQGETVFDTQEELLEMADAAIAIVLERVESHLSAVQYDPAPYTAMKYRLRQLAEDTP